MEALHAGFPLDLGGPRHRRLLAALLLHAGDVVPSRRLIQASWGDAPPRSAQAMLHVRVSELRAALRPAGAELLTRGGYVLKVGPDDLDAWRFERLAASGAATLAAGDPRAARDELAEALALWRGPALAEFADEPFARVEAARLEELRLQAIESRVTADLDLGAHATLIAELEALVAEHPLRERFWARLMLALYRSGRQSEALKAYQTVRRLMAEQVGLDPGSDLRRLQAAILRQDPELHPPRAGGRPPAGNLPAPLTTFVGRRRDVPDIRSLLRTNRLVTLTGVGGAGKSRLAVETSAACLPDLPDGAWLVELAPLTRPGLVASTVAAVLQVREHPHRPLLEVLAGHIGSRRMLLVLDNCEHLIDEVAGVVDQLLRGCAHLRILATSRERLGITGEVVRPVSGLGVPGPNATGVDAIGRADAVRLFVERAAAAQPGFALTDDTAAAAAEICRRLDGLPLALELAAASVHVWGLASIAARLDDPFGLLTQGGRNAPTRHRTLQAVVEWSYRLLDARERRLFRRLAVFAGGFTARAVEAVCDEEGGGPPVAERLASLVDKSLVRAEDEAGTPRRYRMLETLRWYATDRLNESGEAARVRDRHAAYLLAMVGDARRDLRGADQAAVLRGLDAELGNIRAALGWLVERGDATTAVRLAGSLYPLWDHRGHYREGRQWLTDTLDLPGAVPPRVRSRALDSLAGLAVMQADLDAAAGAAEEAARISRRAKDPIGTARALTTSAMVAIYADDIERAVALLGDATAIARNTGDRWCWARALLYLAYAAIARDENHRAVHLLAQATPVLRAMHDQQGVHTALTLRALATWRVGDHRAAAALLREAIDGFHRLGHRWALSIALILAAQQASANGHDERAVTLLAASHALRTSVGASVTPLIALIAEGVLAKARTILDEPTADRAWRTGLSLPTERAVGQAVHVSAAEPAETLCPCAK